MLLKVLSPTCDKCGTTNEFIAEWAQVYRLMEVKAKRPNPGNLCGACAARATANRIIAEGEKFGDFTRLLKEVQLDTKH